MPRVNIEAAGETTFVDYTTNPGTLPYWGDPAFQDEFDTAGAPDPTKWNVRSRASLGLLNDTSIVEAAQCVVGSDGRLKIKGEWYAPGSEVSTTSGPQGNPTIRYMKTGYMEHRRNDGSRIYSQRFGMWQYKVKMPGTPNTSMGTLGAVWLRNDSTAELDLTELWGSGPTTTAKTGWYPAQPKPNAGRSTFTSHQNTSGGGTKEAWTQPSPGVFDGWVEYRFIYTPTEFSFYRKREGLDADWVEQFYITPTSWRMIAGTFSGATPAQNFFAKYWTDPAWNSPWHLRMNLHLGPSTDYWGVPDPTHRDWTVAPTMEVEYVRIYALPA